MSTNAQSYFQQLISLHPLPKTPESRKQEVLEELGTTFPDVNTQDRIQVLIEQLKAGLPQVIRDSISTGKIVIGELGINTPNAYVTHLSDNQFVVVLTSGMCEFIYRIARAVASAVFRRNDGNNTGIDISELAKVIAEIIWWKDKTDISFGPDYEVTLDQKLIANILTVRAECFLLAHELGHVLVAMEANKEESIDNYLEEYHADMTALCINLLANQSVTAVTDHLELMLTYAGAELTLQIWNLLEHFGYNLEDCTHPPAKQRIALLRNVLRDQCESDEVFHDIIGIAKIIENTFIEVINIVTGKEQDVRKYEIEAAHLVSEFKLLLDQCSTSIIPDYYNFNNKALALLSQGYPETILREVFEPVINKLSSTNYDNNIELNTIKNNNQFKLLYSLIRNIPDSIRIVFNEKFSKLDEWRGG